MSTDEIVIVAAARTPFGRFDGTLRDVGIPELGSAAVTEALRRAGVATGDIDEVAIGVNFPGSERSLARQIQLRAGIPEDRNAYTVDRACCSSLAAVSLVRRGLRLGETRFGLAGGAENLGRVPYFLDRLRWGNRLGDVTLIDQLVISCPYTRVPRAVQAAAEAAEFGVGRTEQDEWALRSHERYGKALARADLDDELFPVSFTVGSSQVRADADEAYRPGVTSDKLAALPDVYGSGSVTAGNAPGLSAGASAVVLSTAAVAAERGLDTWATVVSMARASGPPRKIASIPAVAARHALAAADLELDDVDLIEINEAFAAVPLVTTLALADGDRSRAAKLREITNVNGGAIAIGHPTGATAARQLMTATLELRRRGGGTGLITICGGIGEAESAVIRVAG